MPNELTVYDDLIHQHSRTLEFTSRNDADQNNVLFMTNCQKQVVSFDDYVNSVSAGSGGTPMSCDALYRYDANTWFLIEFKDGKLEDRSKPAFSPDTKPCFEVIRKLFESLLLLTEKLGTTVHFTQNNLIFILVYNANKNSRLSIQDQLCASVRKKRKDILPMSYLSDIFPDNPFNTKYFDTLYVKRAYICSKDLFENEFVKKFAKTP